MICLICHRTDCAHLKGLAHRAMTPTTVDRVPNQPKTPLHSFRCDDELWEAAKRRAEERGETLADALRKFLKRYTR